MSKLIAMALFAISATAVLAPARAQHDCSSGCWAVPPPPPSSAGQP